MQVRYGARAFVGETEFLSKTFFIRKSNDLWNTPLMERKFT